MIRIQFVRDRAHEFTGGCHEFVAHCPKHSTEVHFILSDVDLMTYRGSIEELKQVTAHRAILKCCVGCQREEVPALPASRWPEGAEL